MTSPRQWWRFRRRSGPSSARRAARMASISYTSRYRHTSEGPANHTRAAAEPHAADTSGDSSAGRVALDSWRLTRGVPFSAVAQLRRDRLEDIQRGEDRRGGQTVERNDDAFSAGQVDMLRWSVWQSPTSRQSRTPSALQPAGAQMQNFIHRCDSRHMPWPRDVTCACV